jgi:Spy/CpxP family protein refolding chaperone
MRTTIFAGLLALGTATPALSQTAPSDSGAPLMRQRIEARFRQVMGEELGLTDDQSNRVLAVQVRFVGREQAIEMAHKDVNGILAAQLRPGVAGDPGLVNRSLDSIGVLQVAKAKLFAEEQRELATILTPIQRAQLYRLRARIDGRVADMVFERQQRMKDRQVLRRRP